MEQMRTHPDIVETCCRELDNLCANPVDGRDRAKDAGLRPGALQLLLNLLTVYRKNDMIVRTIIQLLATTAVDRMCVALVKARARHITREAADVALRMRLEDVPEAVASVVNAEYDDEYIVADGNRFVDNLSKALIQAGMRDLQVAEFEESVVMVIDAMLSFERFDPVQTAALQTVEVAILDDTKRAAMIDAGLLTALVKIVELHVSNLTLLKSTCDILYRLAKDPLQSAAIGKLDAIHFLAVAMRQHMEERSAVALQTMIYLMSEMVSNNERNAQRWANRRGARILEQVSRNSRSGIYTTDVKIPYRLRTVTEAQPQPETSEEDMGVPVRRDKSRMSRSELLLIELDNVGKRTHRPPRSDLDERRQAAVKAAAENNAERRAAERKRKAAQDAREQERRALDGPILPYVEPERQVMVPVELPGTMSSKNLMFMSREMLSSTPEPPEPE